ncbi:MAG TPA: M1 family metallopeptidase [Chloroflexota bacterium]|jgi:hypothetical protein
MRRLPLVLAGLLLLTATAAEAAETRYEIEAELDVQRAVLTVSQRTAFTNRSYRALPSLAFAVTPTYVGAFELRSAAVGGVPVSPRRNGTALEVPLPSPLPPGGTTRVELSYVLDVPSPGTNRLGFGGGILALGNWYPVLYPLRDGAWQIHQYTPIGDAFVTEVADYEVTLRPSRPVVVASTGRVVARDGESRRIVATDVRDFALAISERYETAQTNVDGVVVTAYYLPEHRAGAAQYLASGGEMLGWLQARLGRYPWRTLDIAETWSDDPNQVGQEYPGIVYISSGATRPGGGMGSYLSYLVAHEVTHQWFYGMVGSDQVREPWLDEAFATYLPERFYADRYPAVFAERWARFRSRLADETARLGARPIDTGVGDYRDEGVYFAVVYRRGAAFLDELRLALGEEGFWRTLGQFVEQQSGRIASGADFLRLARANAAPDLGPLLSRYFRSAPAANPPAATAPGDGADWPIDGGRFFTQTNGGQAGRGYRVTNANGLRFWDEFQRLGGVAGLGYPASRRFVWEGFTVQVFQKAILQWRPEAVSSTAPGGHPAGQAYFVNVLDRLGAAGRDEWLLAARMTPRPFDTSADDGLAWPAVVARHQAMLAADPAIRAAYFADPDPVARFGLPLSHADMGNAYVVRCQRAVFQRWKEDVPWARTGQVTIANGGDLAKESGILPGEALAPESP